MLGAQRPHQRVLHQIVGGLGVAGQRPRVAPQGRNRRLDILVKRAHPISSNRDSRAIVPAMPPLQSRPTPLIRYIFRSAEGD